MEVATTSARSDIANRSQDSERRCLVTGEVQPKTDMIRFVVGPDDSLVPDLAQNLPGRGLWVTATRDCLATALAKNLFARAAKTKVSVAPQLLDNMVQLQRKRCLNFLGLTKRAGLAVLGQTQVEAALRSSELQLVLIAQDASDKGVQDVLRLTTHVGLPMNRIFDRHELGAALGYEQVVYVGLPADALTQKVHAELTRLDKINGRDHPTERNG